MFNYLKKAIQWYCNESAKVYDDSLHIPHGYMHNAHH